MISSITKTKVLKAVTVLATLSVVMFMTLTSIESLSLRKELVKQQQEMVKIQTEINSVRKSQEEFLKKATELHESMQTSQLKVEEFAKRLGELNDLLGNPAGNF